MNPDYALFYRRPLTLNNLHREVSEQDVFISAHNSNERVRSIFGRVRSRRKIWLIHPEYEVEAPLAGVGDVVVPSSFDEVDQVNALIDAIESDLGPDAKICIDVTGFMRHVLIFLIAKLGSLGVRRITALYSEPESYSQQELTSFSTRTSGKVRPVRGLAGSNRAQAKDYVIIGVGYDHSLIGEVLNHKDGAAVFPLFAFPSLSPDMYQQSAVRAARSGDKALESDWVNNRRFAPANDPFSTAAVLSEIVRSIHQKDGEANIYLSPLSTKVQALGFAVYWYLEGRHLDAMTMLLPETLRHAGETSVGIKRVWTYTVELI
jgi:hypothetical protein